MLDRLRSTLLVSVVGTVGGYLAFWLGAPMPFLLGSLVFAAGYSIVKVKSDGTVYFPQGTRKAFVGVIGVLIGSGFSPELVAVLPDLWISALGVILFVLMAHYLGYVVFRKIGRFPQREAYFCAMPGGLIEATSLAQAAGVDVRLVTVQHFARIVLVVASVPVLFFLWSGETVGSAAGEQLSGVAGNLIDILPTAAIAGAGLLGGYFLRIPASHLMGPLLLSALLHSVGIVELHNPSWLIGLAQLVVGIGLGAQFAGATPKMLLRAFGVGSVAMVVTLSLSLVFAGVLSQVLPVGMDVLFISYAPGGVSEMGLIALSLSASPVVVSAHHLLRIVVTVLVASRGYKVIFKAPNLR